MKNIIVRFPQWLFIIIITFPISVFAWTSYSEMVPMRDGISLATEIYLPDYIPSPYPVILQRTPYDRSVDSDLLTIITDVLGYACVSQNVRGTYDSEGEPMVFLSDGWGEFQDGYDCIDWIIEQEWCDSNIGMMGGSAPGMTQYMLAGTGHPNLTCIAPILAGPSMYHHTAYNGGVFRKVLVESWLTGIGTPYLIDTVTNHPDYDSIWQTVNLAERWDYADVPAYHIAGWFDMYTDGQIEAFSELQSRYGNQKLLIAPCGHGDAIGTAIQGDLEFPANSVIDLDNIILLLTNWYNYWLKGISNGIMDEPRVKFYLMGDCDTDDTTYWNKWVESDTWPPEDTTYVSYYILEDGVLDTIQPSSSGADTFLYDPENPCPTIGGREFVGMDSTGYGPKDQTPIESRSDVLVYSTPVLTEPVEVIGKLWFILYASSDRFDTDFAVRVTDVYPDGRSILMTDNILMARHRYGFDREDSLTPGVADTFKIDLWSTANVFNTGHRIRVIISSSNYPRFEKNPNTGAPFMRDDPTTLIATNTVYHSPTLASHLLLPIVPFDTSSIASKNRIPEKIQLFCSPNPFNSSVKITVSGIAMNSRFHRGETQRAKSTLKVFDLRGNVITSINMQAQQGIAEGKEGCTIKSTNWCPDDEIGSGIYLVRVWTEDGQTITKRIVYLK